MQIEFSYGTDVRMAAVDIENAVSRVSQDLPSGAEKSRVMTFSTAARPVYTVGIVADDLRVARRLAEDIIAPRLQSARGVAAVDVFGGQIATVMVDVDPALAEAHKISLFQVSAAISSVNRSVPAGRLRSTDSEIMLRVDQRVKDGGRTRRHHLAIARWRTTAGRQCRTCLSRR